MKVLKKNSDFEYVIQNGRKKINKYYVVYYISNGLDDSRVGISVGKKFGNAVKRNRQKRILREIIRLSEITNSYDLVIISRPAVREVSLNEQKELLLNLLNKL